MEVLYTIGNFLLSEWLWGLTWGSAFIPINMGVLLLFLWVVIRMPLVQAALLSVGTNIASFLLYTGLVHGGFTWLLGLQFDVTSTPPQTVDSFLSVSFSLGLIYSFLQTALFSAGRKKMGVNFNHVILVVVLSNLITALLVQGMIRVS